MQIFQSWQSASLIPVPGPLDMKGNVFNHWMFFEAQQENYKIVTGLDGKAKKVSIATSLSLTGRECYLLKQHPDISTADRKISSN